MKSEESPPTSSECRIRARRLLNQLRSGPGKEAWEAAARFRKLHSFSTETVDKIIEARDSVKLKHALAVIASEYGYESWQALKKSVEERDDRAARTKDQAHSTPAYEMYDPRMDIFLNRWFTSYEDARASREEAGGFLLPFKRQFFVCEKGAIRLLGLDPDDPDWERIGWDWAEPRDPEAWLRLKEKRERALQGFL